MSNYILLFLEINMGVEKSNILNIKRRSKAEGLLEK